MSNQNSDNTDILFQALLEEYKSIREASLSRDQIRSNFENFMMLFLSASIIALPTIISEKQYIIILMLSLICSSLSLARIGQGWLIIELAIYERDFLRPRLVKAIGKDKAKDVWQWQSHFSEKVMNGRLPTMFAVAVNGLDPLFFITSLGTILLFTSYRGLINLSIIEITVFVLSCIMSVLFIFALIFATIKGVGLNKKRGL